MDDYKIIRFYADNRPHEVRETGLTLEAAQTHCQNPDASEPGVWFDGYSNRDY